MQARVCSEDYFLSSLQRQSSRLRDRVLIRRHRHFCSLRSLVKSERARTRIWTRPDRDDMVIIYILCYERVRRRL